MKTVISISNARRIPLGHKCALFVNEDEVSIALDDADFDFDLLDQVMDLHRNVPRKNQLARGLIAKSLEEMMKIVGIVLNNLPKKSTDMDHMNVKPTFRKAIVSLKTVHQTAYNKLQDLVSKSK